MLCFALAHFPLRYVDIASSGQLVRGYRPVETAALTAVSGWSDHSSWRAAGWPVRFYVEVRDENRVTARALSLSLLAANLVCWGGLSAVWLTYGRISSNAENRKNFKFTNISVLDLLMLMLVIAGCISYWSFLSNIQATEQRLAKEIQSSGGDCEFARYVPQFVAIDHSFAQYLPLNRITGVSIDEPKAALIDKVLELNYLEKLYLGGGAYDLRVLNKLPSKCMLRDLRVSGRKLDPQSVAAIGACNQVAKLSLMNTDINAKGVQTLATMASLVSLNLIRTEVDLSQVQFGSMADRLQEIYIPHPGRGEPPVITIEAWPKLRRFTCSEPDERVTDKVVTLKLKNLPALSSIVLDTLQIFDLAISDTPALMELVPVQDFGSKRVPIGQQVPDLVQLRSFECQGVPKLKVVKIWPRSLKSVSIDASSEMRLELNQVAQSQNLSTLSMTSTTPTAVLSDELTDKNKQSILNSLGKCAGLKELSMNRMLLDKVDLSPLKHAASLRRLDLRNALLTVKQLVQLRELDQLEYLDLEGNQIDGGSFARLVSNLPNVKKFAVDSWVLGDLKLPSSESLQGLFSTSGLGAQGHPNLFGSSYQLKDLPKLAETLDLTKELRSLHLENIPSIRGISTRAPWPRNTFVQGLRNLEYFAGGGPNLTDEIAQQLLDCEPMTQLTLAHSNVSHGILGQLGKLRQLKYLCLAGANVDDSVVEKWSIWKELQSLNLDQTAITDASIPKLSQLKALDALLLGSCNLTERGIEELIKLPILRHLSLSKSNIDKVKMALLIKMKRLYELDLSECEIDNDAMQLLIDGKNLSIQRLTLQNCTVDVLMLDKLMAKHHDWLFNVAGIPMASPSNNNMRNIRPSSPLGLSVNPSTKDYQNAIESLMRTRLNGSSPSSLPTRAWEVNPNVYATQGAPKK
ncbi:MAG: hypothetical protein ABL921_05425 [Pirellula sp.]